MKNDQIVFKKSIVDGANEVEHSWCTDALRRNVLPFSKDSIRSQKLLIDGAGFYANSKGWIKGQKEKPWRNCLVTLRKYDDTNPRGWKKISRYPTDQ